MQLAVLSDIHGNLSALEAVLSDLALVGTVNKIWVLGDLAYLGPQPSECAARLIELRAAHPEGVVQFAGGNTDRWLVTNKVPELPAAEDAAALVQRIARMREHAALHTWTLEQLSWEQYAFLASTIGQELTLHVPGFGTVIGFHAIPGDDESMALRHDSPDEEAADALLDREGRLALAGHTHVRMDRTVERWRVVNPGSVGFSFTQSGMAEWALLRFEEDAVTVDLRAVPFSVQEVLSTAQERQHPAQETLHKRLNAAVKS